MIREYTLFIDNDILSRQHFRLDPIDNNLMEMRRRTDRARFIKQDFYAAKFLEYRLRFPIQCKILFQFGMLCR